VRAAHRLLLLAAASVFVVTAISAISAGEARLEGAQQPAAPAGAQQPAAPAGAQQPQISVVGTPAGYVGSDTCVLCHDQEESLKGTAHAQALNPRSPQAKQGCESCHGPGQAHVDDDAKGNIKKFGQLKPTEVNTTCLSCHNRGVHAGWEGSGHEARNLSCTTCHSVHTPASPQKQLVKATETQVCATCHRLQVAKTERAVAHMPVREGKMSCSSCHNPHGSITNVKNLKTGNSVSELCTTCHTEMRGPVLFEHAPVRENCTTCHDPHGSSNDRMLVVRMPMLCQRCHIASRHPATLYDKDQITTNKSNRMFGRSCVNCHSAVHGSNHPSGQFYMR
jgi:DmsE family decaheme c-type cytochrome